MQNPQNKLKEIIWEITGRCENHCSYCGSKDVWYEEINEKNILSIANAINDYLLGGEINISGGDPLLVPLSIHQHITDEFKSRNNKVKIIVNPKSLLTKKQNLEILDLYDVVGVSVNTSEELTIIKKDLTALPFGKFTIITNFNIFNIWEYDVIEDFVKQSNLTWQIQYTMNKQELDVIYNKKTVKNYLFENIQRSINNGVMLVIADNMNKGPCSAGINSCGILSTGEVIPCLSMRSWANIDEKIEGNLMFDSLKEIWEEKFYEQRFCEFECCKDICEAPFDFSKVDLSKTLVKDFVKNKPFDIPDINIKPYYPQSPRMPQTMLYGVGAAMAYAVHTPIQDSNFTYKGEAHE